MRSFLKDSKGEMGVSAIIGAVISVILVFYVVSSTYTPMETAATDLQANLGAYIENESLGTCDASGNLTATLDHPEVDITKAYYVWNNHTNASGWTNATVHFATGGVVTIHSHPGAMEGNSNDTYGNAITIDYYKKTYVDNISTVSSLPGVAVLIFVLVVMFGLIIMAVKGSNF